MHITMYSHAFAVTQMNARDRAFIKSFADRLVEMKIIKTHQGIQRIPERVYAATNKFRSYYLFHIHCLEDFFESAERFGIAKESLILTPVPLYNPMEVELYVNPTYSVQEHQQNQIAHAISNIITKIIEIQTGKGKSFCALYSVAQLRSRVLFTMRPGYIPGWIDAIDGRTKILLVEEGDIVTVSGSSQLIKLIAMAQSGLLHAKLIFISNKTMQDYISYYEDVGNADKYGCAPHELCETLGIGIRVNDETHQDFHLTFKLDLYLHCPTALHLTATLVDANPFMNKMYNLMFPPYTRVDKGVYHRYVHVKAVSYQMIDAYKARIYNRGTQMYNHNAFETWIMKHPKLRRDYFKMIHAIVQKDYLDIKKEGQKLLVFFSSIEMVYGFIKYLEPEVDSSLVFAAHVDKTKNFDNLLKADIIVSTPISAGTAVDIPRLIRVINTISMGSPKQNLQLFGRLRDIVSKEPEGTDLMMIYLYCSDIAKQCQYHQEKIVLMDGRALTFRNVEFGVMNGRGVC